MKRIVSCLLAVLLCILCTSAAFAAYGTNSAALYNTYADGMLFQQNAPAVFAGTASGVAHVQCELLDSAGKVIAKAQGPVNKSNRFAVSLPAPKGGYSTYTVQMYADGTPFVTLHNIVFGELWLASGQSNMDYPLGQSETGKVMQANGEKGSVWLRFYHVPSYVRYHGSEDLFPVDPQREIEGGMWYDGTNDAVYGTSAVAFFFAAKLQKELDMPVGILQSSLGGSSVYSWISRESIEEDDAVREDLLLRDRYFPAETWSESGHDVFLDMTVNYNKKIAPLGVFRPAGMIWYQGETDLFREVTPEMYARAFDCMQRCHSRLFGYRDDARLPIVYTQLVSYNYGGSKLQCMNDGYARMQMQYPDARAVTPVYDVVKDYLSSIGYIHPSAKKPIGERMAYAAEGLVYGMHTETYTAAYPAKTEIRDGSVSITLAHTGRGLVTDGAKTDGFAVCGADGIYVEAEAEIVSADTVRVYAESVPNPSAVSYAFAQMNDEANLYASDGNGRAMPVSPFITDPDGLWQAWQDKAWTTCDKAQTWRLVDDKRTGYWDTWQAKNADLSFADGMLSVRAAARLFSVQPTSLYRRDGVCKRIPDGDYDFSHYRKITFTVQNCGRADVDLSAVRFYTSGVIWYAPAVNGTDNPDCTIPADGQPHEITLDLDTLYLFGNECGLTASRAKIDDIRCMRLQFNSLEKDARINLDAFRFTPDGTDGHGVRFVSRFSAADNVWEAICALCMLLFKPIDNILARL